MVFLNFASRCGTDVSKPQLPSDFLAVWLLWGFHFRLLLPPVSLTHRKAPGGQGGDR